MKLRVERIEWNGRDTLAVGTGKDDKGREVRFAGDWRPMHEIAAALDHHESVEAEVEPWQVLSQALVDGLRRSGKA